MIAECCRFFDGVPFLLVWVRVGEKGRLLACVVVSRLLFRWEGPVNEAIPILERTLFPLVSTIYHTSLLLPISLLEF